MVNLFCNISAKNSWIIARNLSRVSTTRICTWFSFIKKTISVFTKIDLTSYWYSMGSATLFLQRRYVVCAVLPYGNCGTAKTYSKIIKRQ